MDLLFEAADKHEIATILTIDKSAAFDSVNVELLLQKLEVYGLDQSTLRWFRSYLMDRTQYVQIVSQSSSMRKVSRGVPQGSVLFSENCTNCGITPAYTDDATHMVRSTTRDSNQQKLCNNLQLIANYLEANQLTVNQGKTQILETMVHQKHTKLSGNPPILAVLDNKKKVKIIKSEPHIKLLGMNLAQSLDWDAQLFTGQSALLPETRKKLGSLYSLRKEVPRSARLILATGLILSKIQYTIAVWGGAPTANSKGFSPF